MAKFSNVIKRHPLTAYSILTVVISWTAVWILAGPGGFPVTPEQAAGLGMAILLGPSIAGLLMTGLYYGRPGFRKLKARLIQWRSGVQWYALALLTAPLTTAAVLLMLSFFSLKYSPAVFVSAEKGNLLAMAVVAGVTVGIFEELGWTGFAVHRMKERYPTVTTGVITGLLWGAWHFPLFWETESFSSMLPFVLLLAKLFSWLPPYRILMVVLYKRTENLLLVVFMHISLVATLLTLDPVLEGKDLLVFILARAVVFWVLAAGILFRERRTSTGNPPRDD